MVLTDSDPHATALSAEAHALHRAVFGGSAPDTLVRAYIAAHRALWPDSRPDGEESVRRAVERGLDLEAVELVLRLRKKRHALVQKAQILVYLAEALQEYQARLVGGARVRGAMVKLVGHGARTALKLAKGAYLVRRHRLG